MTSKFRAFAPALVAVAALVVAGCSETKTPKDVANSQKDLNKARQQTQDTVADANREVAEARQNVNEHLVNKPVTSDNVTVEQQKIADAQHDANQKIADAKANEQHAAAELKTTQQQAQLTQERDMFVQQAEQRLADYDKRIDELKQQASTAEGANKEAIDRQIDSVKQARDRANSAISDLKGADLAAWKNHEGHVRTAFQDLDNSVRNVR